MLCQIAVGPEFQNFMSLQYVASFLGPCRASENLNCYPKMSTQSFFIYFKLFRVSPETKYVL